MRIARTAKCDNSLATPVVVVSKIEMLAIDGEGASSSFTARLHGGDAPTHCVAQKSVSMLLAIVLRLSQ